MKNILALFVLIMLLSSVDAAFAWAKKPHGDINLRTKAVRMRDDTNTPLDESKFCQLEFSSDCADCGKIFIRIDGKYAGQIDVKYRNTTILVKQPGIYKYTATSSSGQMVEGEIVAP
jgi:hypothetical protein